MKYMAYEEPYEYMLRRAKKEISTSDHLLYVTYRTIENPKFLVSISEHIIKSAKLALRALLEYEVAYKRLFVYVDELAPQLDIFQDELYKRHQFTPDHLLLLRKLRKLEQSAKEAVISFRRDDRYFFSNQQMETESVGLDDVKALLKRTKSFIAKVDIIISNKEEGW